MACSELPNVAPFVIKCYDIVDDPTTNDTISWSEEGDSIVIWDEFALERDILPKYFKHNNINSFIRQLQSYGFRKVVAGRVEYANELFVKGKGELNDLHKIIRQESKSNSTAENSTSEVQSTDIDIMVLLQEIHRIDREKYRQMKQQVGELFQSQVETLKKLYYLEKQVEAMAQSYEQMQRILEQAVGTSGDEFSKMRAYMENDDHSDNLDVNDPHLQNSFCQMFLELENEITNVSGSKKDQNQNAGSI